MPLESTALCQSETLEIKILWLIKYFVFALSTPFITHFVLFVCFYCPIKYLQDTG